MRDPIKKVIPLYGGVFKPKWNRGRLLRKGPLTAPQHSHPAAIFAKAVNIDILRSDHPVHMDHRAVSAARGDIFFAGLITIGETLCITLTQSDMAGGIFIKQSIVKQQTGL